MTPDQFDWKSGKVVFWDLDSIDAGVPLEDQATELKEDLAQVRFPSGVLLDVGWYPEFSREGNLVVLVTRPYEFHQPLFRATAKNIQQFEAAVTEGVRIALQG